MSRVLTYATVCSGIECCSVAARGLPLRPVFFSEIEPFPCAVLKAHYPDVPNLGDMSKIQVSNDGKEITNGTTRIVLDRRIDILAGGTPCQDISQAGKQRGMAKDSNTRSSLAFDFVRLASELRPKYVVWENVAATISSKIAGDFLRFLSALDDCGYSLAWRVLDAQYVRVDGMERAVPQRRRRIWCVGSLRTVGHLGADESVPAEILFEPDCVAGHTPPRRRAGQGFAYTLAGRDRVDAGVVGEPAARIDCLNFQGSKGNNCVTDDGSCPNLNAMHGHDVHVVAQEGDVAAVSCSTKQMSLATGEQCANPVISTDYKEPQCIALDGDKLKPREDPRKGGNGFGVNEEGVGYTLTAVDRHGVAYAADGGEVAATITRQIAEQSGQDNRANAVVQIANGVSFDGRKDAPIAEGVAHSQTIGTNPGFKDGVVQCFENHAQDSRVQGPIDTAPTQGSSNANSAGVSGNNPLVVHTAMAQNTRDEVRVVGDGNIAGALAAQLGMKQQTYVVSTNSNGEDVAATLDHNTGSTNGIGAQNDKRGGYVVSKQGVMTFQETGKGFFNSHAIAETFRIDSEREHKENNIVVYEKEGAEGEVL